MFYQKRIFSLICTLFLLSTNTQPSHSQTPHVPANTQSHNTGLQNLILEWNNLEFEQSCVGHTLNVIERVCAPITPRMMFAASSDVFMEHLDDPTNQDNWYREYSIALTKRIISRVQECWAKPQQCRQEQNQIKTIILTRYSFASIQQAAGPQHPLSIAAQNHQKMQ